MRLVLIDESLPRPLAKVLVGFDFETVHGAGWSSAKNGELLRLASARFEVFLTGDKNLRYQQNLSKFSLGIVVVAGRSTKLEDLLPLVPAMHEAIRTVKVGELVEIGA